MDPNLKDDPYEAVTQQLKSSLEIQTVEYAPDLPETPP